MEKDLLEGFARYLDRRCVVREGPNQGFPVHYDFTTNGRRRNRDRRIAGGPARGQALNMRGWYSIEIWPNVVWRNNNLPGPVSRFFEEAMPQTIHDAVQELLGVRITGWHMVEHTTATILRLACLGNAIFVGRGANIITANQKSVFHVRLMAPFAKRVRQDRRASSSGYAGSRGIDHDDR